ncbi:MAG: fluoride efflux transporter CrcB [Bacteroides sp.]|uniref:fluoride efflux transporter CrcB n=1 Tax=Bacteroides sp. TaxID=29523 RepID=UPI002FC67190
MFKAMLIAGAGGFVGTCARYLVGKLATHLFTSPFPYGTFAVNVIGSLIIGLLFGMAEKHNLISTNMNILLITGFCGGFTTFSSFADDMYLLMQNKHWSYFSIYLGLSIILGIVLVWVGRSIVKAM